MWILRTFLCLLSCSRTTVAGDAYIRKPTLVDIRGRITAARMFAEIYAQSHPRHAKALHHFGEEITKMVKELGEAVYGKPIME
jgi:hypothetical protein